MDKSQEASAPPNMNDPPPPYPGAAPTYALPPAGRNRIQYKWYLVRIDLSIKYCWHETEVRLSKYFYILGVYPQLPGQAPPMQAPVYVTGPQPVQQPAQQIVIVQGPIKYGKNPMTLTCPHCQSQVLTSIRSEPGPLGKNYSLSSLIFIYVNIQIRSIYNAYFYSLFQPGLLELYCALQGKYKDIWPMISIWKPFNDNNHNIKSKSNYISTFSGFGVVHVFPVVLTIWIKLNINVPTVMHFWAAIEVVYRIFGLES